MESKTFMLIAGEVSGDMNAAELVLALKDAAKTRGLPFPPQFIGAGGPRMTAAGVDLAFDLTRHAVIGPWEALKKLSQFKRSFDRLLELAIQRQPDVIVLVDFSGFNLRFAAAVKKHIRRRRSVFSNWRPKIVYYVLPQLWASREARVHHLVRHVDLVLSIFPFEKGWYAERVPQLPVEFVGHPMVDRFGIMEARTQTDERRAAKPLILLLPGSRDRELAKHLPVMLATVREIQSKQAARFRIVVPNASLEQQVRQKLPTGSDIELRMGDLAVSLAEADLAIAKSGTVTLECAFFGLPTVVVYITNPLVYAIARRVVKVNHLAMPNLLAREEVFPELLQDAATPNGIANEALTLLNNLTRRAAVQDKLREVVASLGAPGAARRAAEAIWNIVEAG